MSCSLSCKLHLVFHKLGFGKNYIYSLYLYYFLPVFIYAILHSVNSNMKTKRKNQGWTYLTEQPNVGNYDVMSKATTVNKYFEYLRWMLHVFLVELTAFWKYQMVFVRTRMQKVRGTCIMNIFSKQFEYDRHFIRKQHQEYVSFCI